MSLRLFAPMLLAVTCETFMPGPEADGDDVDTPSPASLLLGGCAEPEFWLGESCASQCDGGTDFPMRCSENGCGSPVVAYRLWDACGHDPPVSAAFPLDLSCTDILDESLLDDYYYIACCCEEYDDTSGPNLDTESG